MLQHLTVAEAHDQEDETPCYIKYIPVSTIPSISVVSATYIAAVTLADGRTTLPGTNDLGTDQQELI